MKYVYCPAGLSSRSDVKCSLVLYHSGMFHPKPHWSQIPIRWEAQLPTVTNHVFIFGSGSVIILLCMYEGSWVFYLYLTPLIIYYLKICYLLPYWMSDSCIGTWMETWLTWMVLRYKSQGMDWGEMEFTGPGRRWDVTWMWLRRSYMDLDGNEMQILGPRWRLNGTPIPGPCWRWDVTRVALSN